MSERANTSRRSARRGDDMLLFSIAAGKSVVQAAADAGISVRTAHRRMENPDFAQQLSLLRSRAYCEAVSHLLDATGAAVDALVELVSGAPPGTRLAAAKAVLELGIGLKQMVEMERRLSAIEEKSNGVHA